MVRHFFISWFVLRVIPYNEKRVVSTGGISAATVPWSSPFGHSVTVQSEFGGGKLTRSIRLGLAELSREFGCKNRVEDMRLG